MNRQLAEFTICFLLALGLTTIVIAVGLVFLPKWTYGLDQQFYYISPVVRIDAKNYQVALHSYTREYSAIIPSKPDGTPVFTHACVSSRNNVTADSTHARLPLLQRTDTITAAQAAAMSADLNARGIIPKVALVEGQRFEQVVVSICSFFNSHFQNVDQIYVGTRP